jgi:hypothetical protein
MKSGQIIVFGMLVVSGLLHAAVGSPETYSELPAAHQLDFWIGEWDVVDAEGEAQGFNRIESTPGGCVVTEHWVRRLIYATNQAINCQKNARDDSRAKKFRRPSKPSKGIDGPCLGQADELRPTDRSIGSLDY